MILRNILAALAVTALGGGTGAWPQVRGPGGVPSGNAALRTSSTQEVPAWARGAVVNHVTVPKFDKVIALTFDDGPNAPYTQRILKILKAHNARATFFMLGEELAADPALGREIRDAGHAIGNHSWSHPAHPKDAAGEVSRTDREIHRVLNIDTTLFRPPYGIMTNGLSSAARARSEAVLLWSIDTFDWKRPGANRIVARVLRGARSGRIVLMHDGGGNRRQTVGALAQVLDRLRKQGYRFVTIPELLQMRQEKSSAAGSVPNNHGRPASNQKRVATH